MYRCEIAQAVSQCFHRLFSGIPCVVFLDFWAFILLPLYKLKEDVIFAPGSLNSRVPLAFRAKTHCWKVSSTSSLQKRLLTWMKWWQCAVPQELNDPTRVEGPVGFIGIVIGCGIWVVVKMMVSFWVLSIIWHLVFWGSKRHHTFDNHP